MTAFLLSCCTHKTMLDCGQAKCLFLNHFFVWHRSLKTWSIARSHFFFKFLFMTYRVNCTEQIDWPSIRSIWRVGRFPSKQWWVLAMSVDSSNRSNDRHTGRSSVSASVSSDMNITARRFFFFYFSLTLANSLLVHFVTAR